MYNRMSEDSLLDNLYADWRFKFHIVRPVRIKIKTIIFQKSNIFEININIAMK